MSLEQKLHELKTQRNNEAEKVIEAAKFIWDHRGGSLFAIQQPYLGGFIGIDQPYIQIYGNRNTVEIVKGGSNTTLLESIDEDLHIFHPGPWVQKLLTFVEQCEYTWLQNELAKFEEINY